VAADTLGERSFVDKDREHLCGAEKGPFFLSTNGKQDENKRATTAKRTRGSESLTSSSGALP
jgi:hypothetical protein